MHGQTDRPSGACIQGFAILGQGRVYQVWMEGVNGCIVLGTYCLLYWCRKQLEGLKEISCLPGTLEKPRVYNFTHVTEERQWVKVSFEY